MIPAEVLALVIPIVQEFEGCKLTAYKDPVGVWTIGWGHTGSVQPGQVWSQEEADNKRDLDIAQHYTALDKVSPGLRAPPSAALTDFVYNLGIGTYLRSSLPKNVAAQDWLAVKKTLALYVHAGGKVLPGLARRRDREIALIDA